MTNTTKKPAETTGTTATAMGQCKCGPECRCGDACTCDPCTCGDKSCGSTK